jgi:uncharacterized membrane protein YsdA (DUF1294 family)
LQLLSEHSSQLLVLLGWYAGLSVVTYFVYWADKAAAERRARRVPEVTLHLLGLAGGWPGGLIAQVSLRHKTRKSSFLAVFWVTVVMNCLGLAWLVWMLAAR